MNPNDFNDSEQWDTLDQQLTGGDGGAVLLVGRYKVVRKLGEAIRKAREEAEQERLKKPNNPALFHTVPEYWIGAKKRKSGAGGGNRTRVASLEGWSFTTKLRPQGGNVGHVDTAECGLGQMFSADKPGTGQGQYVLRATYLLANHLHTVSTNLEGRALRALRPLRTFYLPKHNRGVAELPPARR